MELEENLLLIDKPKGITSFDVIRRLRSKLLGQKIGHAGTLDPLASGLLLLGVGPGTKKLANYVHLDKEYEASILLGEQRLTGDMEGKIIKEKELSHPYSEETLQAILKGLVGVQRLPVSAYSAIKKEGVPMYKRARQAERQGGVIGTEELPIRDMEVYDTKYISTEPLVLDAKKRQLVKVRFHVGSGTYVRSLAEELGSRLGYPATLYDLRRTKIGEFTLEEAKRLEDI